MTAPSAEARERAAKIVAEWFAATFSPRHHGPTFEETDPLEATIARALAEKDGEIKSLTRHREILLGDRAKADAALREKDAEIEAISQTVYKQAEAMNTLKAALAEARRERDEARGYESEKEALDVRGFFDALKESGLDAVTHEDGWALTTPSVLDGMKEKIAAQEAALAEAKEQAEHSRLSSLSKNPTIAYQEKQIGMLEAALAEYRVALERFIRRDGHAEMCPDMAQSHHHPVCEAERRCIATLAALASHAGQAWLEWGRDVRAALEHFRQAGIVSLCPCHEIDALLARAPESLR